MLSVVHVASESCCQPTPQKCSFHETLWNSVWRKNIEMQLKFAAATQNAAKNHLPIYTSHQNYSLDVA